MDREIKRPSVEEVEKLVAKWHDPYDDYADNEKDLDYIFGIAKQNNNVNTIVRKIKRLNKYYKGLRKSAKNESVQKIAKGIVNLNIDNKLKEGDIDVVEKIANVTDVCNYSFATKYCAFHYPEKYALYDSLADTALWYFQTKDNFSNFCHSDLKVYRIYMKVIEDFKKFYGLEKFSLREIDHYLWFTGKLVNKIKELS